MVRGSQFEVVNQIAGNLAAVRDRVAGAVATAGRSSDSVRLVAVSKTFPVEDIQAAYNAGQRDFGENKVQEALQKIAVTTELEIRWHLIGHLQSNKARKAGPAFHSIHSIDSVDLLLRVERAAVESSTTPEVLIQVDLAGENSKHGIAVDQLAAIARAGVECRAARLTGLMLLPPWSEDPEATRPYFRRLRELRDQLVTEGIDPSYLRELSMGMSHDYEVAIQEGATIVRVGTAIFGKRTVRT
jgi:pyridoxal phosphate enzyme (YggS family)